MLQTTPDEGQLSKADGAVPRELLLNPHLQSLLKVHVSNETRETIAETKSEVIESFSTYALSCFYGLDLERLMLIMLTIASI